MCNGSLRDRSLSHRELFYFTTLACVLILIPGLALASPPLAQATALRDEETPEAFMERVYAQRATAMTLGDPTLLDGLYDPANPELLKYEKDRIAYFQDGFWASLRGKVLAYQSSVRIEEVTRSDSTVKARVYETLLYAHVPRAKELPPWAEEVRQQGPREYAPGAGRGPHGEVISGMGTPHEVTLVKNGGGWRISKDFYWDDFGLSPGAVIGSWAVPESLRPWITSRSHPVELPPTGSAETPFPFAAVMGVILLGLGLVVRGLGDWRRLVRDGSQTPRPRDDCGKHQRASGSRIEVGGQPSQNPGDGR